MVHPIDLQRMYYYWHSSWCPVRFTDALFLLHPSDLQLMYCYWDLQRMYYYWHFSCCTVRFTMDVLLLTPFMDHQPNVPNETRCWWQSKTRIMDGYAEKERKTSTGQASVDNVSRYFTAKHTPREMSTVPSMYTTIVNATGRILINKQTPTL